MATILLNKLNIGSSSAKNIYVGSTSAKCMYVGSTLVYDTLASYTYGDITEASIKYNNGNNYYIKANGTSTEYPILTFKINRTPVGYSGNSYTTESYTINNFYGNNLPTGVTVSYSIKTAAGIPTNADTAGYTANSSSNLSISSEGIITAKNLGTTAVGTIYNFIIVTAVISYKGKQISTATANYICQEANIATPYLTEESGFVMKTKTISATSTSKITPKSDMVTTWPTIVYGDTYTSGSSTKTTITESTLKSSTLFTVSSYDNSTTTFYGYKVTNNGTNTCYITPSKESTAYEQSTRVLTVSASYSYTYKTISKTFTGTGEVNKDSAITSYTSTITTQPVYHYFQTTNYASASGGKDSNGFLYTSPVATITVGHANNKNNTYTITFPNTSVSTDDGDISGSWSINRIAKSGTNDDGFTYVSSGYSVSSTDSYITWDNLGTTYRNYATTGCVTYTFVLPSSLATDDTITITNNPSNQIDIWSHQEPNVITNINISAYSAGSISLSNSSFTAAGGNGTITGKNAGFTGTITFTSGSKVTGTSAYNYLDITPTYSFTSSNGNLTLSGLTTTYSTSSSSAQVGSFTVSSLKTNYKPSQQTYTITRTIDFSGKISLKSAYSTGSTSSIITVTGTSVSCTASMTQDPNVVTNISKSGNVCTYRSENEYTVLGDSIYTGVNYTNTIFTDNNNIKYINDGKIHINASGNSITHLTSQAGTDLGLLAYNNNSYVLVYSNDSEHNTKISASTEYSSYGNATNPANICDQRWPINSINYVTDKSSSLEEWIATFSSGSTIDVNGFGNLIGNLYKNGISSNLMTVDTYTNRLLISPSEDNGYVNLSNLIDINDTLLLTADYLNNHVSEDDGGYTIINEISGSVTSSYYTLTEHGLFNNVYLTANTRGKTIGDELEYYIYSDTSAVIKIGDYSKTFTSRELVPSIDLTESSILSGYDNRRFYRTSIVLEENTISLSNSEYSITPVYSDYTYVSGGIYANNFNSLNISRISTATFTSGVTDNNYSETLLDYDSSKDDADGTEYDETIHEYLTNGKLIIRSLSNKALNSSNSVTTYRESFGEDTNGVDGVYYDYRYYDDYLTPDSENKMVLNNVGYLYNCSWYWMSGTAATTQTNCDILNQLQFEYYDDGNSSVGSSDADAVAVVNLIMPGSNSNTSVNTNSLIENSNNIYYYTDEEGGADDTIINSMFTLEGSMFKNSYSYKIPNTYTYNLYNHISYIDVKVSDESEINFYITGSYVDVYVSKTSVVSPSYYTNVSDIASNTTKYSYSSVTESSVTMSNYKNITITKSSTSGANTVRIYVVAKATSGFFAIANAKIQVNSLPSWCTAVNKGIRSLKNSIGTNYLNGPGFYYNPYFHRVEITALVQKSSKTTSSLGIWGETAYGSWSKTALTGGQAIKVTDEINWKPEGQASSSKARPSVLPGQNTSMDSGLLGSSNTWSGRCIKMKHGLINRTHAVTRGYSFSIGCCDASDNITNELTYQAASSSETNYANEYVNPRTDLNSPFLFGNRSIGTNDNLVTIYNVDYYTVPTSYVTSTTPSISTSTDKGLGYDNMQLVSRMVPVVLKSSISGTTNIGDGYTGTYASGTYGFYDKVRQKFYSAGASSSSITEGIVAKGSTTTVERNPMFLGNNSFNNSSESLYSVTYDSTTRYIPKYKFVPTITGSYKFTVDDSSGSDEDTYMYILNSSGTVLATDDDSNSDSDGDPMIEDLSLTAGTTYYICPTCFSDEDKLSASEIYGDLSILINNTVISSGSNTISGTNRYSSEITYSGTTYNALKYNFTSTSTGTWTFAYNNTSDDIDDTYMIITNSSGTVLAADDDSNSNSNPKISISLTSGTTYYVYISSVDNNDSVTDMSGTLTVTAPSTLTIGDPLVAVTPGNWEQVWGLSDSTSNVSEVNYFDSCFVVLNISGLKSTDTVSVEYEDGTITSLTWQTYGDGDTEYDGTTITQGFISTDGISCYLFFDNNGTTSNSTVAMYSDGDTTDVLSAIIINGTTYSF